MCHLNSGFILFLKCMYLCIYLRQWLNTYKAGLELKTLQPQPPKGCNYRCGPPLPPQMQLQFGGAGTVAFCFGGVSEPLGSFLRPISHHEADSILSRALEIGVDICSERLLTWVSERSMSPSGCSTGGGREFWWQGTARVVPGTLV